MYKTNETEREILAQQPYNYNPEIFDILDAESDKIRKGEPVDLTIAVAVIAYQENIKKIRKRKKWWEFWTKM